MDPGVDRNVKRQPGRQRPIFLGSDTRKRAKLSVEVRLIAEAGRKCPSRPRFSRPRLDAFDGSLEPKQAAIDLGSKSNGLAEQDDEAPMAVAALSNCIAYVGHLLELFQRLSHGR